MVRGEEVREVRERRGRGELYERSSGAFSHRSPFRNLIRHARPQRHDHADAGRKDHVTAWVDTARLMTTFTPQLTLSTFTITKMIRRPPTLIPMTEADIQQVKDFVEARKQAAATDSSISSTTGMGEGGSDKGKLDTLKDGGARNAAAESEKERKAMSKEERLGLK